MKEGHLGVDKGVCGEKVRQVSSVFQYIFQEKWKWGCEGMVGWGAYWVPYVSPNMKEEQDDVPVEVQDVHNPWVSYW